MSGTRTLKDAVNEAIRDWVTTVEDSFYVIGSVMGPHPYPLMVRDFQKIIGEEAKAQILEKEGRLPDQVVACVGGGRNAMGIFHAFVEHPEVALVGGGRPPDGEWRRASTPPPSRRESPACSTAPTLMCSTTETDRSSRPTPFPPGSTIPAWARAQPPRRNGPGILCLRHRRRGRGSLPAHLPPGGDHPGPGELPRPRPRLPVGGKPAEGHHRAGESVRPGRQGHGHHPVLQSKGGTVMKTLSSAFEGKKALVTYIAAGDPDLDTTAYLLKLLDTEVRTCWKWASPSPTPWRDGPVIQQASQRALAGGATLKKILGMLKDLPERNLRPPGAHGVHELRPRLRAGEVRRRRRRGGSVGGHHPRPALPPGRKLAKSPPSGAGSGLYPHGHPQHPCRTPAGHLRTGVRVPLLRLPPGASPGKAERGSVPEGVHRQNPFLTPPCPWPWASAWAPPKRPPWPPKRRTGWWWAAPSFPSSSPAAPTGKGSGRRPSPSSVPSGRRWGGHGGKQSSGTALKPFRQEKFKFPHTKRRDLP